MDKDYSYQCNYCISRLICLNYPQSKKCNFCDNEQYFKECIYTFGNYNYWNMTFKMIKDEQSKNKLKG